MRINKKVQSKILRIFSVPFFPRGKKGFEFSSRKFIQLMILLIVFLFLVFNSTKVYSKAHDGLQSMKFSSSEKTCEINSDNSNVFNCDLNSCTEKKDQDKWKEYLSYLNDKNCPSIISDEIGVSKDKKCTCLQQQIFKVKKGYDEISQEAAKEREQQFKTSGVIVSQTDLNKIYSNNNELISTFAKENKIAVSKLKAFIQVESSGKPFYSDGHPIVRFECLKFNTAIEENKKISCSTSTYKFGNAEDTGKEAFLRALKINEKLAIQTTSFGMGQVMGSNYNMVGYNSEEEFYKAMFLEQNQIKVFFQFIINKNGGIILQELQKENTDWAVVAKNYNGPKYKDNNYDVKLALAEKTFSSSNTG